MTIVINGRLQVHHICMSSPHFPSSSSTLKYRNCLSEPSDSRLIFNITVAFLCRPTYALHTLCADSLVLALLPCAASEHSYIYFTLQCGFICVLPPSNDIWRQKWDYRALIVNQRKDTRQSVEHFAPCLITRVCQPPNRTGTVLIFQKRGIGSSCTLS